MADPVLHIKDAYYFEVPKLLAPANYKQRMTARHRRDSMDEC